MLPRDLLLLALSLDGCFRIRRLLLLLEIIAGALSSPPNWAYCGSGLDLLLLFIPPPLRRVGTTLLGDGVTTPILVLEAPMDAKVCWEVRGEGVNHDDFTRRPAVVGVEAASFPRSPCVLSLLLLSCGTVSS